MNHYEPGTLVLLVKTFTISLVLVSGSVLLFLSVTNVALAVDMPDAPNTQDTITAGKDGNDNADDDEDDDQPDNFPDPEDAPITTESFTSRDNEGSIEDKSNEENNNEADGTNVEGESDMSPRQDCSNTQERALFSETCIPMQVCPNQIGTLRPDLPVAANCVNAPTVDHPSTE